MSKGQRRVRKRTMESALNNILRNKSSVSESILSINRMITSNQSDLFGEINPILLQNCFQVSDSAYAKALNINNNNLIQIEKISKNNNPIVELNYLKLAVAYVVANVDRVNAWIELDRLASTEAFSGDPEVIRDHLMALSPVDQQALASMRLYAALYSFSDDIIREYLANNMPSHWTQNRLLYPLVYYSINLPDAHALDQMLSQVFPSAGTGGAEKLLTKFLLQPENPDTANLAMRCYVSLISHPYDALEYLVADIERRCAEGETVDASYLEQYELLASAFPKHRVTKLCKIISRDPLPFLDRPEALEGFNFPIGSPELSALFAAMDVRCKESPPIEPRTNLMNAIVKFRWSRYPDPIHFEELHSYHRRYSMLTSSRLVRFISSSLYLFSRERPSQERLNLLQGTVISGAWLPLAATAPQGHSVTSSARIKLAMPPSEVLARVDELLGRDGEHRADRVWINAANWALMPLQMQGRVIEWAASAREKFPVRVQPRYLSGLDWNWLSGVIEAMGMRSLMGHFDIVYTLFIKQLEEYRRESMPLRVAIEPILRSKKSIEDLSEWLHDNFARDTAAFLKYFLSADTILKLRLTDNYMAAVSARLDLFERSVRKYGFVSGVFEEEDLRREQDGLTAMLCRMSVGARQFEISWDALRDNAAERTRDAYTAYETVLQAMSDEGLANTRRSSTYQYASGVSVDYDSSNRDWPLVLCVAGVIETFLTHPTTGIESILSVRIRHDHFRREYENAIHDVEISTIMGSSQNQTRQHAKNLAPPLYREVQRWLDNHMHTHRKDKPSAFFNFIPTKRDMHGLIEASIGKSLHEIVDLVLDWTKPRLDAQLEVVRTSLANDLGAALERKIPGVRSDTAGGKDTVLARVADAVAASVARRTRDLDEWFRVPEGDRDQGLTVEEVMNAVRQRFRMQTDSGALEWRELPNMIEGRVVAPRHIRHLYDLLSEIVHNALKHSHLSKTTLQITAPGGKQATHIVVANPCDGCEARREEVMGHPFESMHDSLFGEGKSGLKKVAYLTASIMNSAGSIQVLSNRSKFRLVLPIDVFGTPCESL